MTGGRGAIRLGSATLLVLAALFGLWGTQARLAGAVVAQGRFMPEGDLRPVQHLAGGTVTEVRVRNGDPVVEGAVLIRLDSADLQAERAISEGRLLDALARLSAVPDTAPPGLPPGLDPGMAAVRIEARLSLEAARGAAQVARLALLAAQRDQVLGQIDGLLAERAALDRQTALITAETDDLQILLRRGLTDRARLRALERRAAELGGMRGRVAAGIATGRARLAELDLQATGTAEEWREDLARRMQQARADLEEETTRWTALRERLEGRDLRAPVAGVVTGLGLRESGVLAPGETALLIVPTGARMLAAIEVPAARIGHVSVGQRAVLKPGGQGAGAHSGIPAQVIEIAAAARLDAVHGEAVYTVLVAPDAGTLGAFEPSALRPGAPVQAMLRTSDRSPVAYLMEPLLRHAGLAFRTP